MLYKRLVRLAHELPHLRPHLLPLIKQAAACEQVTGGDRADYEDKVWEMFVDTYRSIGLILTSPSQLYKYPVWEICRAGGDVVAFNVFKSTPYGFKSGLSGSDGSSQGKRAVLDGIRTKFKRSGYFGEVSHKVEAIALASGAPVVCAAHVGQILKKDVEPEPDGIHYTRNLKNVGRVKKILVGKPKSVPVTDAKDPQCPIMPHASFDVTADDDLDLAAHFACMAL